MANTGGGVSIVGNLADNADTDVFEVVLRAGEVYDFWLGGDFTEGGGFIQDGVLTLSGPGIVGVLQDQDSAEELNANIIFRPTVSGTFTLTVEEFTGAGTGGDYALTFTNRSFDDDIADNTFLTDDTGGLPVAAGLKGTSTVLNQDDVLLSDINEDNRPLASGSDDDFVAVFLVGDGNIVTGNKYTFEMRGFDTGDGDLAQAVVQLQDADGNVIDTGLQSGSTSTIATFDPDSSLGTGWYFLRAGDGNTGSTYELQFTSTGSAVDVAGDTTTLFNVPLNGAVQGTIGVAGDEDWYAINLVAGFQYRFDLTELGGTLDPHLTLFDSAGSQIDFDDNDGPGNDAELVFTATTSGLHFLGARDAAGTQTGSFQLSATLLSAPPSPVHSVTVIQDPTALGSDLDDSIGGSDGFDDFEGGAGDDTLTGGLGDDTLIGGGSGTSPSGDDSLDGGDGGDLLGGEDGNDTIDGGADGDLVFGGDGIDSLLGGTGNDSVDGGSDTAKNTLDGGDGNDTLVSALGGDSMTGGTGDDDILGIDGNDTVSGGDGNDIYTGLGGGNDAVDGGIGNDTLRAAAGNDTVNGGEGDDAINGGDGTNLLNGGNGNDTFEDVDAGDLVTAGAGTDHVQSLIGWTLDTDEENLTLLGGTFINGNGNTGGNVIFGNSGNNVLSGLGGNDTVNGGAGADTLIGGFGKDLNTGGAGLDHIRFNALGESGVTFATRDAINTFAHGDKIDLSAIDANTRISGNQAFVFSASQSLTGQTGIVIAQQVATNSFLVLADINGDAHADFSLNVYTSPGFGNFAGFDFIL
jgi:serralysin